MASRLKPCSFCQGDATIEVSRKGPVDYTYLVARGVCGSCDATGPPSDPYGHEEPKARAHAEAGISDPAAHAKQQAATAWNTRPEPSADGPELWAIKGPDGTYVRAPEADKDQAWWMACHDLGLWEEGLDPGDSPTVAPDIAEERGYRAVRVRLVEIPEPAELADGGGA